MPLNQIVGLKCKPIFFLDSGSQPGVGQVHANFEKELATSDRVSFIREKSGDFLDYLENRVQAEEIFICSYHNKPLSFGIIDPSKLLNRYSSIGMFVFEENRQKGFGTSTLLKLKEACYKNNQIPVAGCWYYNHNSKKTLEKAGMVSKTRLLKFRI